MRPVKNRILTILLLVSARSAVWKSLPYDANSDMLSRYVTRLGRMTAAFCTCSRALGIFRKSLKQYARLLCAAASDGNLLISDVYSSTHFCRSPVKAK